MDQWEYAEVLVVIGGPLSGTKAEVTFFHSNDKHEHQEGSYGKTMAVMGEQGWELVAASARIEAGLSNKHKIHYVFKRKKGG